MERMAVYVCRADQRDSIRALVFELWVAYRRKNGRK
jgi:hypothetical protein